MLLDLLLDLVNLQLPLLNSYSTSYWTHFTYFLTTWLTWLTSCSTIYSIYWTHSLYFLLN